MEQHEDIPVVLYDGYCNLCSWIIQFISRRKLGKRFILMPTGSEKALELINRFLLLKEFPETVILIVSGRIYTKSDTILEIIKRLGFPVSCLWVFTIIPRYIRDPVYSYIAKKRFVWFGRRTSCYWPGDDLESKK